MKLSRKLESEVMQVYNTWMHSYLNGDVKTYDAYLDKDYRFIGSTGNEEFLNKKDTTKFFKATADQLAGKTEIRNSVKTVEQLGDLVILTDLLDAWFLNATQWTYYGRFRFTSALQKKHSGWKFVYQHFSTPDEKAQEGETIGYDQISEENLKLREAIKRRTIELEDKNRALQVEAALERVRSRTMAMRKSEELQDAAMTMFQQLEILGIPVFGCGFNIWNKDRKAATAWIAGKDRMQPPFETSSSEDIFLRIFEAGERGELLFVEKQAGEELVEHYKYMTSIPVFKEIAGKMAKTGNSLPAFQIMHCAYFQQGYLMFISFQPVPEAHDIFKRFAKVFEQTYTRFLDLKKAEAQTREAQIETALERLRSKSIGMQSSDELSDLSLELVKQVQNLGISTWFCAFNIYDEGGEGSREWGSNGEGVFPKYQVPREEIFLKYYNAGQNGETLLINEIGEEECPAHYEYLCNLPGVGDQLLKMKANGRSFPTFQIDHVAFFKYGYIIFITYKPVPESHDVFKRFAKVFEQTYTRFLDLQKAEAQAREAQIETALERVRSRTMGMHESKELEEVIKVVFDQLLQLNFNLEHAGFLLDYKLNNDMHIWLTDRNTVPAEVRIPYFDTPHWNSFLKAKKQGDNFFTNQYTLEEKNQFYQELFKIIPGVAQETKDYYQNCKGLAISTVLMEDVGLYIENFEGKIFSEEENETLIRFGKVFQQAYTRFRDLEKAEAQAREAQVEAALERVRSRTMAMQKSEDLNQAASEMFEQIQSLGVILWGCGFNIFDKDEKAVTQYMSLADAGISPPFRTPLTEDPFFIHIYKGRKRREELLVWESKGTSLEETYHYMFGLPGSGEIFGDLENSGFEMPRSQITHCAYFSQGYLVFITYKAVPEAHDIFKRFSRVFEQTYTRFLDLQKAEAQAREAQIEAALERVRSKTMAMHNSEDMEVTVVTLFDEVAKLGIDNSIRCGIGILDENTDFMETYSATSNPDGTVDLRMGSLKMNVHPMLVGIRQSWITGKSAFEYYLDRENLLTYYTALNKAPDYHFERNLDELPEEEYQRGFFFNEGILFAFASNPFSKESVRILSRFAAVFEQTYTRFLDLQKAEAQARESQIEAALERVRSRSMAMHKSDEIGEVASILFQQLKELGGELWGTGFAFCKEDNEVDEFWFANEDGIMPSLKIPNNIDPVHKKMYEGWKKNKRSFSISKGGKQLEDHYKYMLSVSDVKPIFEDILESRGSFPKWQKWHAAYFKHGYLLVITTEVYKDEEVFPRFAKVFEQAYRRFLDLQKAEAQAKEAQIEAALERVRSRAMAMRSSEDIGEATTILFKEIENFEIETMRCGILIIHKNKIMDVWTTYTLNKNETLRVSGQIDMSIHPLLLNVYRGWEAGEALTEYKLQGEDAAAYYEAIRKEINYKLPVSSLVEEKHYNTCFFFKDGALFAFTKKQIPAEALSVFQRFAKVFGLTYQRYRELIESEKREKEANKQAALDRVRGEIASMRSKDDLKKITPIIWRELINLGVPFIRCGVFIMNEDKKNMQVFLSDPQGKALGIMSLDFATNDLTQNSYTAWRSGSVYRQHWNGKEFSEWTQTLIDLGKIEEAEFYQGGRNIPESLDLHFVPFEQGMLYVGNLDTLSDEHIGLVKNLAKSFSIAYARYEDFSELEKAKENIEKTLVNLKATQKQLVQSEKMASLGQLTAGIAHEIKNPLNFVNNFSEVSKELLAEMTEELEKGNYELVVEIAGDVNENLEKILHHGKRADGIVKGMLQHSRSNSGKREEIAVNSFIDEYLRLAYHGLRAKDKSFNARLETKFDENAGKILVVHQEMGRVVLNLLTNAFYAVSERKRLVRPKGENIYEPTVWIGTHRNKDSIDIKVKDNGGGIPENIQDKIFQPFFTTKPTGQGTGLGLSLSYDIVKAHGGELEFETLDGKSTTFTVSLPLNKSL